MHAITVSSGSAFVFLFLVAVQGLLINVLRPRAFKVASLCLRLSAVAALLLALFLLPIFSNLVPAWAKSPEAGWFYWLPPLWFVGVYQTLLGSATGIFHSLARTAVIGLGLAALACGAGYIVSYRRPTEEALETAETHVSSRFGVARATRWALTRFVLRKPLERAAYFFVVSTLMRSTTHRLYPTASVGVGSALATFGILQMVYTEGTSVREILFHPSRASLAIPLILSFFMLAGMRIVFTIPAELRANWVFQIAEDENRLD